MALFPVADGVEDSVDQFLLRLRLDIADALLLERAIVNAVSRGLAFCSVVPRQDECLFLLVVQRGVKFFDQ